MIETLDSVCIFVKDQETRHEPWGTSALLEDSEGNRLLLVQDPGGTAS